MSFELPRYYEQQCSGLGEKFLDDFDRYVREIGEMPRRWMIQKGDIRKAVMQKFPYAIYFRHLEHVIRITVVKHQRQHLRYGLKRT